MTRDTYTKATVALDKSHKLQALREKIKREFPEFEYDAQMKEIGEQIFSLLDAKITGYETQFSEL